MSDSRPAVVTRGLVKRYGEALAVDHIDLEVAPGTFFGFLGPNGAGKTTTIRILSGLLRPSEGAAEVAGVDVLADPVGLKRRIGVLPEEFVTYNRLSAAELLSFSGRMHGIEIEEIARRRGALFEMLGLEERDATRPIIDYSLGMRKKVGLACALVHSPDVLFLDEPFNGVDTITTRNIRATLEVLISRGLTIFFSSHVLDVVEKLCDAVAIIHEGRLRQCGDLASLRASSGLGPDATLEDIFVHEVGGAASTGQDLDWIG